MSEGVDNLVYQCIGIESVDHFRSQMRRHQQMEDRKHSIQS